MARQRNSTLEKTIRDVVHYKQGNKYYARKRSTLSRETVLTAKAFENTRRSASRLATAAKLASSLYALLPKEQKSRKIYQTLTGLIKLQLKQENSAEEIITWFNQCYLGINLPLTPKHQPTPKTFDNFNTPVVTARPKFYLIVNPKRQPEKQPLFTTLPKNKPPRRAAVVRESDPWFNPLTSNASFRLENDPSLQVALFLSRAE